MSDNFKLEQVSVRLNRETPLYSEEEIQTPEAAVRIVGRELMAQLDREQICIINLNGAGNPINFSITSVGTLNHALIEPREMLKASILSNAGSVIMLHNHPSGNLEASRDDYEMTERMIRSFDIVGIKMLDHIIVGGNNPDDFFSIRENHTRLFEDYEILPGELQFSDISDRLVREIDVFLVAEDLSYWVNNTYATIELTNDEAELILNYMDGHGYNLGVNEGQLVRIDAEEETPTAEKYDINTVIYDICDWNSELISETNKRIDAADNIEEIYNLREYKKSLRADEDVLDGLFKKTNLGKTLELGNRVEEQEKQQEKQQKKERAI